MDLRGRIGSKYDKDSFKVMKSVFWNVLGIIIINKADLLKYLNDEIKKNCHI